MFLKVTVEDQSGDGRGLAGVVVLHARSVTPDHPIVNSRSLFLFPCKVYAKGARPAGIVFARGQIVIPVTL